eukprot:CAMPEP_0113691810 /NCGR_PEP_ID=MMETSP0038_2-20120614/18695_1 /TAXON_ID=2898 /ORGANISM="Cryptomonas paramecium" /LENGTH=39 /DNA_ID=CAMNT_0000613571 /DNA_START=425 /DNA_END=544 /DNA_ORIENTATION=+ /assembly_acc=CAM_ASM_000170
MASLSMSVKVTDAPSLAASIPGRPIPAPNSNTDLPSKTL